MFLRQVADAPLVATLGNEVISIPRFTLGDFATWGAELDHDKLEEETKEMTPDARFRHAKYEPIIPTTKSEMRHRVKTVSGTDYVCRICLSRATVLKRDGKRLSTPDPLADRVGEILPKIHGDDREYLALVLTGMAQETEDPAAQESTDEKSADPLDSAPKT